MRIAIVVGEQSGDILGAGLIAALKARCPEIVVEGIGGPRMIAAGCHSFFPQDRLAVMGLIEPLKRLPELLNIRKTLREQFIANPPDVFIGIDSPDFNLPLAASLKAHGIKTVHYVSPSVWAWRQGRLKTISRAVDVVLTLFPFEADFYQRHAKQFPVNAMCVGHTLADHLPLEPVATAEPRAALGLADQPTIALMPGSRAGEVARMAPVFIAAAKLCLAKQPDLQFVLPAANPERRAQLQQLLREEQLPISVVDGQSHLCMQASDAVLMASGTTSLEAMLLKKPMVIAYKMAPLSYAIISRLLNVPFVGLPNLLAGRLLVPELLQDAATPPALADALLRQLQDPTLRDELAAAFTELHQQIKLDASERAADAVMALIRG